MADHERLTGQRVGFEACEEQDRLGNIGDRRALDERRADEARQITFARTPCLAVTQGALSGDASLEWTKPM